MESLKGKVAVVTGAAQGIGYAIARILLQNGAKVCLVDIQAEKGKEATQLLQKEWGQDSAIFVKCDVTSEAEFSNVFIKTKETFGGLDIVCNNAGVVNEPQWRKCVEVNLSAVIQGTFLGIEHMSKEKGGKGGVIINIGSTAGLQAAPYHPVYSATKSGVINFSRSLAMVKKYSGHGVRINCICPSFVDTDLVNSLTEENTCGLDDWKKDYQRVGTLPVSRVVEAFLTLVQDGTRNGEALRVTPKATQVVESGSVLS